MKYLKYYKTKYEYESNKHNHIDPTVSLIEGEGVKYSLIETDDDYTSSDDYACSDDYCNECVNDCSCASDYISSDNCYNECASHDYICSSDWWDDGTCPCYTMGDYGPVNEGF